MSFPGGRGVGDRQLINTKITSKRGLDQAQARASYTPLFWGHSRSIPQGMILDVQPLVKSLFCPIRPSPKGLYPLKLDITFWGGLGGGGKSFRSEGSKQWGSAVLTYNCSFNGNTADAQLSVVGSNPAGRLLAAAAAAPYSTGVRTAVQKVCGQLHYHSATA